MTFEVWMNGINSVCETSFGMSIHDLPDMCFRDAYDCGMSPEEFMTENLPDLDALRDLILS